jgi:hypothetical protein
MTIAMERTLAPDLTEAAWEFYNRAFAELRTAAVQRHLMLRAEFDAVMTDERVWKYRGVDARDPTAVTALATFTNALDAMPLISPEYFRHHWPDLYAERRIWYLGFFAVDPDHRGSGMFEEVIAALWQRVLDTDGIAVLDICRRNEKIGLSAAIHQTLLSLTEDMRATRLDEQTYWLYEPSAETGP